MMGTPEVVAIIRASAGARKTAFSTNQDAEKHILNGKWAMGNGQWAMGNGKWAMGNGQWAMGNGKWEES
jgi:hypothetical protein